MPRLAVKFFRQAASLSEPVREWLKSLPEAERKVIGEDIKAAQFGRKRLKSEFDLARNRWKLFGARR